MLQLQVQSEHRNDLERFDSSKGPALPGSCVVALMASALMQDSSGYRTSAADMASWPGIVHACGLGNINCYLEIRNFAAD